MANSVEWVAVDWGTSNVRAWGVDADGSVTFSAVSDRGMGRISREAYPDVLRELMSGRTSDVDVLICGMAGARQGWLEAPYLSTPTALARLADGAVVPAPVDGLRPSILPGVCQSAAGLEDVMRGEETQVLGLLALRPGFAGTAIMPGTHSKWVRVVDGGIAAFATAMTGELYDVLSAHSVLRHSFAGDRDGPATEAGIEAGLAAGLEHPEKLLGGLFRARAAALLSGKGADWCSGYLSGLLVGSEVGGHRDWLSTEAIPLIGSERLCRLYAAALSRLGVATEPIDATAATLAGLKAARQQGTVR